MLFCHLVFTPAEHGRCRDEEGHQPDDQSQEEGVLPLCGLGKNQVTQGNLLPGPSHQLSKEIQTGKKDKKSIVLTKILFNIFLTSFDDFRLLSVLHVPGSIYSTKTHHFQDPKSVVCVLL